MKKLLLLVSVMLGYSALGYGMDKNFEKFKANLTKRHWNFIHINIREQYVEPEDLGKYVAYLLALETDLNTVSACVHDGEDTYLLDNLLQEAVGQSMNARVVLKELIRHGKLDTDLKGRRVQHLSNFSADEMASKVAELLQTINQEIEQEKQGVQTIIEKTIETAKAQQATMEKTVQESKLEPGVNPIIEQQDKATQSNQAGTNQQPLDQGANTRAPAIDAGQLLQKTTLVKRGVVMGVMLAGVAFIYMGIRWCTKKVDKDEQNKNATDGTDGNTESNNQEIITV